jgi:deoxyhypusine synthase
MQNPSFKRKRKSNTIRTDLLLKIKGFTPSPFLSVEELVNNYATIGFQASHLYKASEIVKKMKEDNATIFLSFTSNMISCGLREIIAYLCKEKLIHCIVTTTGSIEEDIMKSFEPFYLGKFEVDDEEVKRNKLNRIGNIFVKDQQYVDFEKFHMKFIEEMYKNYGKQPMNKYVFELGGKISDQNSFLYWCNKNKIPVFLPGPLDGAIGDHIYYFNKINWKKPFVIDASAEINEFYDFMLSAEKTGAIILGGGIAKHHLIGAAILRNGLDYAVYLSTGTEYDGSLSGARPREAVSWNKLKRKENSAYVEGDATLTFPLLACIMAKK